MTKIIFKGNVQGHSMQPLLNHKDILSVVKIQFRKIKIGDIIVFRQQGRLISHRVIFKKRNQIYAKGDNTFSFDKSLNSSEILGKVVQIDGKYGLVNLNTNIARYVSYYFVIYSLITYYPPILLRNILTKIIRGRKFLIKCLSVQQNNI